MFRVIGAIIGGIFRFIGRILGLTWKAILTVLLIVICTGFLFVVIFSTYVKNTLSDDVPVKLSELTLNQTSTIYYWDDDLQDYAVLDKLSGRSGACEWVNYENMNKWFEYATVAIEDQRFYDHFGVDWFRTFGAFYEVFLGDPNSVFGGSTITQQLIKNITQYKDETVKRKLLEIFRALEFEKNYTKEEIVEGYLNLVYFGENSKGIQAASLAYFGKDQSELTLAECAAIVGITNNPSMYDPYLHPVANKTRQEIILREMFDQGYIKTQAEYDAAVAQKLVFGSQKDEDEEKQESGSSVTTWFVDALIEDVIHDLMELKDVDRDTAETLLYTAGYQIYTTFNPGVQAIIDDVYSTTDNLPSGYRKSATQDLQSSIVVMDPFTGDILGLSGGIGEKTLSRCYNRATQMQRSPGSTIKPLASYSICLDEGLVHPWTVFDDSDFVKLNGTSWYPNNDDSENEGAVTLRYALQVSINTIAAQMIDMIGPRTAFDRLTQLLGFTHLVESRGEFSDVSYAGMALGQLTDGETVREMCQAYTIFCNNGIYTEARTYTRIDDFNGKLVYENIPESHVALKETTAYYMTEMLTNAVNRGTGWLSKFGSMEIAGKSGGSSSWHDRWFIAYTPYLLAAVWTGYDYGENMGGSNPATGMWRQVMERVHAYLGYEDRAFGMPSGMKRVTVCVDTGLLAGDACAHEVRGDRTMSLYMMPNEMPTSVCQAHVYVELCSQSMELPGPDCPSTCMMKKSVLDPSKYNGVLTTPDYYPDGRYPKKMSYDRFLANNRTLYDTDREEFNRQWSNAQIGRFENHMPTEYVTTMLQHCHVHTLDPVSGWNIDSKTGYITDPVTGIMYDTVNDRFIDPYSKWEVDRYTGMLIDPQSGAYINPHGGAEVILTEEELAAAVASPRYTPPAGYGGTPAVPPAQSEETPGEETGGEESGEETGGEEIGGEETGGEETAENPPAPVETPEPTLPPEEMPPEETTTPFEIASPENLIYR